MPLRFLSFTTALCFCWSLVLATPVRAALDRPSLPPGHSRVLSVREMSQITGSATPILGTGDGGGSGGSGGPYTNPAATPGSPYSWEGALGGIKVGNGNKLTSVSIVGWTGRGGMPINLTLNHNSESTRNGELGPKWLMGYDSAMVPDINHNVTVYWGDGRVYTFTKNVDGSFTSPAGIYDTLTASYGRPPFNDPNAVIYRSFTLVTKNQTAYHFDPKTGQSSFTLTNIQDKNGNGIGIAYVSGTSLVQTITDATGRAITLGYTNSKLTSVTDPLNRQWTIGYDGSGNLTSIAWPVVNGAGWARSVGLGYDGNHNITSYQDKRGNTSEFTYSSHNRLLTVQAPLGRNLAITYDAADNPTQLQEKDAAGNVKATTTLTIGAYGLVSDKYDANNHHTAYAYDANGYLNSVTTPMGHKTQWMYDALGFQTSRTDAMSRTTTYTSDTWERNVKTSYPDGTTNTYGYDANSNLTAFANPVIAFTRTYDADNRMTFEYTGTTRTGSHSYDAAGQKGLLSTTTDYDGRVISYAYSARNELASVGDSTGTTTYTYDVNGRQNHLYNPNGTRVDESYNADGSLDSYYDWNGGSTIFASFGYAYNADGQITSENEGTSAYVHTTPNPTQTAYGYDAQGHLTSEVRTGSNPLTHNYGFDPAGNRTLFYDGNTSPQTYDADDQPVGIGGPNTFTAGYNANGDRISETFNGQSTTFGYDYDDQLVSIAGGGVTTSYRYDALGRQMSKEAGSVFTGYYLDGDQVLIEKQGGANTAQYLWGNGLIRCNGEYPLTDGRVNIRLSTNATQQVTSTNQPDAFGVSSLTAGTASAYSYGGAVGYRQDGIAPAGLPSAYAFQKVGARYYDPAFGCFLTRDTDLSQSPYAYCDGDPVNGCDPTGHETTNNAPLPLGSAPPPGQSPDQGYGAPGGPSWSGSAPGSGASGSPGGSGPPVAGGTTVQSGGVGGGPPTVQKPKPNPIHVEVTWKPAKGSQPTIVGVTIKNSQASVKADFERGKLTDVTVGFDVR